MSSSLPSSGEMNYKGVRRRKSGSWVSEIRLPNSRERIWLGSYDTPEKAARAFDTAYLCLRGGLGGAEGLNFPSSPPAVVVRTSDRKEVLAAALSHANQSSAAVEGVAAAAAEIPSERAATVPPAVLELAEVPPESFDDSWRQVLADNPLHLVSPHRMGSPDMPVSSFTAAAADDMEENENGWFCELWRFDDPDE